MSAIHNNEAVNEVTDREIIMSRLLNAPRELVWQVWTEQKHLANWWGPYGFTTTTDKLDIKTGGAWKYMMHGPDGRNYPNRIVYTEVVKPERLVYKHAGDEDTEPVNFHVTITFTAEGNKTRVKMRMTFPTAEELQRVNKEYGAVEGGKQTIARMEEYLIKLNAQPK